MSTEDRIEKVKQRLQKEDAWLQGAFDDAVESIIRAKCIAVFSEGRTGQVRFLLENGYSTEQIIGFGLSARNMLTKFHIETKNGKYLKKEKHKHHH